MSEEPDLFPYLDPAPAIVTFDVSCNGCGYNLLGLPRAGVCPECGRSIEQSLQGNLLENSDPEYVAKLARGLGFVLLGIPVQLFVPIIYVVGLSAGLLPSPGSLYARPLRLAWSGFMLVTGAAILYGWWLFTTGDPSLEHGKDASKSREWIRNLLLVSMVVQFCEIVTSALAPRFAELTAAIMIAWVSTWIGRYFFEMSYVRWIGRRIPSDRITKAAFRMTWLGPVLVVCSFPTACFTIMIPCTACVVPVLLVIAVSMYWSLLLDVRTQMKRVLARQIIKERDDSYFP